MARTHLGQNFLVSDEYQKKIVGYFEPPSDFLEIGPGRGALTQHLSQKFQNFTVIEKDPELMSYHQAQKNYHILNLDFLEWDFSLAGSPVENFSFIGNLPYESGSAMLQKIVEHADQVEHFVFLLQKEVVERIAAKPKSRDFASFSILVQGQFDVEALDVIGPEHFRPPPKVESQIVRGRKRTSGRHPLDRKYQQFLKRSFLHKRKTLKNAWKGFVEVDKLKRVFEIFHFSDYQRAEEIAVDLWPNIFMEISK
jgi:16S rRNA (adenine1518-N6/adenine1519-N6)-dimethyltransferase